MVLIDLFQKLFLHRRPKLRDQGPTEGSNLEVMISAPESPTRMDRYRLAAVLKEGVVKWNGLRSEIAESPNRYALEKDEKAAEYILDLAHKDFMGLDLNCVNLSSAYLYGTKFTECDLTGATFANSYLLAADFKRSKIFGVDFSGAELYGLKVEGSSIEKCTFTKARMTHVNLSRSKLPACDFSGANLEGAQFEFSDLNDCNFNSANLEEGTRYSPKYEEWLPTHTSMLGATLERATLSESDLTGARLNQCDLTDSDLSKARLQNTQFTHAKLQRTKGLQNRRVVGVDFTRATFIETILQATKFDHCKLSNAVLSSSDARAAEFVSCDFSGARFVLCNLVGARFEKCDFRGTAIEQCRIEGASFPKSDLRGTPLASEDLKVANFDSATFSCPACTRSAQVLPGRDPSGAFLLLCDRCGRMRMDSSVMNHAASLNRMGVLSFALAKLGEHAPVLTQDSVKAIESEWSLPNPSIRVKELIRWIGENSQVGSQIDIPPRVSSLIGAADDSEITFLIAQLKHDGILEDTPTLKKDAAVLSLEGWRTLSEHRQSDRSMEKIRILLVSANPRGTTPLNLDGRGQRDRNQSARRRIS
jgi:uncharacterized protein YjbI with pentapeptide repeats